jgi:steroid Delta-isomerase
MVEEAAVRVTLKRYAQVWERRDRDAWLGSFSPDASQEDPVGTSINIGHDQIGAFWDRAMAMYCHIEIRPGRIHVCGNEAAMSWQIVGEDCDGWVSFEGIDVFTFTRDGLIASVRAYWQQEAKRRLSSRPA